METSWELRSHSREEKHKENGRKGDSRVHLRKKKM